MSLKKNIAQFDRIFNICSGGSKGGRRGRAPPLGVQILSISCGFWEILAKSYVGAPPGELAPPPRGNPGSATDLPCVHAGVLLKCARFWNNCKRFPDSRPRSHNSFSSFNPPPDLKSELLSDSPATSDPTARFSHGEFKFISDSKKKFCWKEESIPVGCILPAFVVCVCVCVGRGVVYTHPRIPYPRYLAPDTLLLDTLPLDTLPLDTLPLDTLSTKGHGTRDTLSPAHEQNDWQTPLKTLPSRNGRWWWV